MGVDGLRGRERGGPDGEGLIGREMEGEGAR